MSVIYVREQGAYIKISGEKIVVTKGTNTLLQVPLFQLEHMSLFGNVQITSQAMARILEKGIDISYFSYGGRYIGHTCAQESRNIFLRLGQYEIYNDFSKRIQFARIIVKNKIENQMHLIANYRWSSDYDWKRDVEQMGRCKATLEEKDSVGNLMGVEGFCSNIYFGAFSKMLKGRIEFKSRNRRPPRDPINAILSLAYTFLTRDMCNFLESESFETYLGFLHGVKYGRKSLALDMIEEFRQPVVDQLVLYLFNKRILTELDFQSQSDGVFLDKDGFAKFCKEYEKWMHGKENYRLKMKQQVLKLKKAIQYGEIYKPYRKKAGENKEKDEKEYELICD